MFKKSYILFLVVLLSSFSAPPIWGRCPEGGEGLPLQWRGLMLDVSRHYMPIEYIYKEVDAMEHFGLNTLHLHLTDAAGWRIEIKSRPRLTDVGAWRTSWDWEEWWNGNRAYSDKDHGFGGYYTQDQLRDLVAYAQKKGIQIVPEIEFPGHSEETVAAYPEVGFNHAELDMQKPETYQLMRDVLSEVAQIFPSPYMHVGGDEAATQNNIQPEGMRRVKEIVDSLGKKMVVWDEALTDEPRDSDMIIMVWRGIDTARKAAQLGHKVILSPGKWCYLDKSQEDISCGHKTQGGFLSVDKVYTLPDPFETPEEKAHLLGVQGNLWTEYVEDHNRAEYMIWPREVAIAELGLNGLDAPRDAEAFHKKALEATEWLHQNGINAFDLANASGDHELPLGFTDKALEIKTITYNHRYNDSYKGYGDGTLADGKAGSFDFGDGWLGFIGAEGMDITLDLGKTKKVKAISADFLQTVGPQIYYPYTMQILTSKDGIEYTPLSNTTYEEDYCKTDGAKSFSWNGKCKARFIRIKALPGEKQGWIFCDEVQAK